MNKMKHSVYILLLTFLVASCKTDSAIEDCSNDSFDRGALLTNWADNIIIPSYTLYNEKLTDLQTAKDVFIETPTEQNLILLRTEWLEAYTTWQNVSIYEIGQAEIIRVRDYTNTYPLEESVVLSNISSGNYNLEVSTNLKAQGFPALDYLINGLEDTDVAIVAKYSTDENAAAYKKYLSDVSERLLAMAIEVVTDWKNNYRAVFIANDCSSSTSALDKLTNDMIFNLEKITRAAKIGIPIDYFNNGASKAPEMVEAFYKQDVSKELLLASLEASQNFFNGKHLNSETEGESLKSYLDELQISAGGRDLSVIINEAYDSAIADAEKLDDNFYLGIGQTDIQKYRTARESIHRVVEILKTNMITALGVKADYNDSDGD